MELVGVKELQKVLEDFAPRTAGNLMRTVIHGVATDITKESKKRVPVNTGTLKRSLKTKRRRGKPMQPVSDVIAESGKNVKNDGFYWLFVEFGTQKTPEQPFMRPAKDLVMSDIDNVLQRQFKDKLTKAVMREKRKRAKK
jgi:HK97 gp10 family phage protein